MNFKENVLLALAGLKSNKMRAFLTMLGIIIGISSVIMITTLGSIVQNGFKNTIDSLGVGNLMQIYISLKPDAERDYYEESDLISNDMINTIKERFGDKIKYTALSEGCGNGKYIFNRKELAFSLNGVTADFVAAQGQKMTRGRFISDEDIDGQRNVCVIPDKMAVKMFENEKNALGQTLTLTTNKTTTDYTIVGVLKSEESKFVSFGYGDNYNIYIPITVAHRINNTEREYFYCNFTGADGIDVMSFSKELGEYINNRFYKDNDSIEVKVYTMEEDLAEINKYTGIISLVLSIIAGISLLVGGIGVMNIMLVSVTERTREIGIRKALGAPNSAIRIQFIVESVIICAIGGAIGIVWGIILGNIGGLIVEQTAVPSIPAIIVAVTFSMAIGVFFGYYPANKAAKLDPIEALRYE